MTDIDNSSFVDYEITFLLTEEDLSPIKKIFEKNGIIITDEKALQKIQLSYPIKKQSQCYMGCLKFKAEPGVLPTVLSDLKLEKNVLRHLVHDVIIKDEERQIDVRMGVEKKKIKRPVKEIQKSYETVLTNEALQEKIEEILK